MPPERPLPTRPNLALLDTVARAVARAKRLSPDDAERFARRVRASIAAGTGEPLSDFEGPASYRTYLTIVVARQLKAAVSDSSVGQGRRWVF